MPTASRKVKTRASLTSGLHNLNGLQLRNGNGPEYWGVSGLSRLCLIADHLNSVLCKNELCSHIEAALNCDWKLGPGMGGGKQV